MRLPSSRRPLLRCNTLLRLNNTSPARALFSLVDNTVSLKSKQQQQQQHHPASHTVHTTSAAPNRFLSSRTSRSPHQWSHIVHFARSPTLGTNGFVMGHDGLANGQQTRTHMGHSHGHHHHHDNSLLTSKDKNDPAVRITRIGLFVNLGMAVAKGAGGYYFNSKA